MEFFLVLPLLLLLLAFPLYLGRYMLHYSTAQAAAASAADYLSRIPLGDITSTYKAPGAAAIATEIVDEMLADLRPGGAPPLVTIQCDGFSCGSAAKPATVTVRIYLTVEDLFFRDVTQMTLPVNVTVEVPYRGR
ncbi:hypothetical protein ASF61_16705 [Duganella sp. Leaf126]|uniref:TadE/TadG family type IV pilus assembly protein n=1 Tax=Duganella sp. Leaf126 TaxID=1736266 RepID=UPI0006F2EE8B|nr:TadE/TadG family type IV pilus assembly protein [Duganella sp. Leaf126]KQQ31976.1 hypothetical protein ASF61_16705 [Duganella sp. Leaf126]